MVRRGLLAGLAMTADEVCSFLALMDKHRVNVWLDGGWAVDASLGHQTRRHGDVDIVIEERDVSRHDRDRV